MESEIKQEELKKALAELEEAVKYSDENDNMLDSIVRLMSMPDEQFEVIAPGVLQAYEQILNNPNEKIALTQSLNAAGLKAEDLTDSLDALVDNMNNVSLSRAKRDFFKQIFGVFINCINSTEGIAKRMVPVAIELCHPDAKIPQYAHISDSGVDVFALDDITIKPGGTVLVPTGIKVALPAGFELQVRPKSGRALKTKLRIANTPGTIDQGYRDEIKIIIENVEPPIRDITYNTIMKENGFIDHIEITSIEYGKDYTIGKGEKFCQLVLCEVPKAAFYRVDKVQDIGEDRGGGFGSSSIYAKEDSRYGTDIT